MDPVVGEVSSWTEFGLAGLFGLFAIICIVVFLRYLSTQTQLWREFLKDEKDQRREVMATANVSMSKLGDSIQQLDRTITKLNGGG